MQSNRLMMACDREKKNDNEIREFRIGPTKKKWKERPREEPRVYITTDIIRNIIEFKL